MFLQGAAAFWYNIGRNGERDERTMHAGCPVALGEKWGKKVIKVQCTLDISRLNSMKYLPMTSNGSPVRARCGVAL